MRSFVFATTFLLALLGASQDISYETISILNAGYLAASNWDGIPLDTKGEDVNSQTLGGNYYPPISTSLQKQDRRTTLARGFMQIEVQFKNANENQYLLEKLILIVDNTYPVKETYEYLEWEIGTRGGDYNPYFELEEGVFRYEDLPEAYVLQPKDEPQDVRITLDVECYEPEEIQQFHVEAVFTNLANTSERFTVRSDKDYFIASE